MTAETTIAPTPCPAQVQPAPATESPPSSASPSFPTPKLRIEIDDLNDSGTAVFLSHISLPADFNTAVATVLRHLYLSPTCRAYHTPSIGAVTLHLRAFDGVAYTTGPAAHKEIHLSTSYITARAPHVDIAHEIRGVLTHELVHVFQHNGKGKCPGGFIEGVADWVRLKAGLQPPHWTKHGDCDWDAGYERTGYFLEFLEGKFGPEIVRKMNERLTAEWDGEELFFMALCGKTVGELWDEYKQSLSS
ncbi:hypothetical protein TD95_005181 [Thielaviopsis punctulata]|uniref:Uncharacterized protein n=1 Tax=Thielaviopsis punctulata TaxID=72032 RepID=A0A0F4ZF42_9PEZI|nr:hypothetical protein TD95_005181 [Thielaviopsis punctulata]